MCKDGQNLGDNNCTWKVVKVEKIIKASCMYRSLHINMSFNSPVVLHALAQPKNLEWWLSEVIFKMYTWFLCLSLCDAYVLEITLPVVVRDQVMIYFVFAVVNRCMWDKVKRAHSTERNT